MSFVKLDCGILDSTLWREDAATCKVFVTMLAMCQPDGLCRATAPGIAVRASLTLGEVKRALAKLSAPDRDSRTPDDDGRRIRRVDGGFFVVNYLKYRNFESPGARRTREWRERQKTASVTDVTPVTPRDTEGEGEGEVEVKKDTPTPSQSLSKTKDVVVRAREAAACYLEICGGGKSQTPEGLEKHFRAVGVAGVPEKFIRWAMPRFIGKKPWEAAALLVVAWEERVRWDKAAEEAKRAATEAGR